MLTPWKTVTPINNPTWVMERNPFFYEVDTAGNQLPYIDRIQMTVAENLEVLNLRAIAGQYDLQERHTAMTKLPVFLENRDKVGYDVRLDPALNGSDATLQINHAYEADPEVAKWLHTADFRRALSMGIDRDQLNETFWLGIGTPGSIAPADSTPYNPGPEWRKKWSTLDVKQANALLDKIGLSKKDGEGYRLRVDGKGRLRIELHDLGGRLHPALPDRRDDQGAVEEDRDPGGRQGGGAEPVLHPGPIERAPDRHLGERRHRAAVPLPAARASRRSGRVAHGHADRGLVRLRRQAGEGARRYAAHEGDGHVPVREREEGSPSGSRSPRRSSRS